MELTPGKTHGGYFYGQKCSLIDNAMFSSPLRQLPLCQVYSTGLVWSQQNRAYQAKHRRTAKLCWLTHRGRSVTRLTGLTRSQFRSTALAGWCWGLQRSSW